MLKLPYTLLTNPLGLPIDPLWEYIILLLVGEIVHRIAWDASPGGAFGSMIYWATKFLAFVTIWGVLYGVITAAKFVVAHWIWFVVGGCVVAICTGVYMVFRRRLKIQEKHI